MARRRKKSASREGESSLEQAELCSLICDYFCREGLGAVEIKDCLKRDHSIEVTREEVYRYIRMAARSGWIRFIPPQAGRLQGQLGESYPWLQEVSVVKTATSQDVSARGARMLLQLLQQHYSEQEVHIGFSGGYALRTLAQRFAELLREPAGHLPRKIVFHALVAGFDVYEPTTDPNAFFTHFVDDPAMQVDTGFVALHAPAVVKAELLPELKSQAGIAEAYDQAGEINVIVTSTSCWSDDHSMLRHYMKVANQAATKLEAAGCLGDLLWQPIGPEGPIELDTAIRAMTIQELRDLSAFVSKGNQVLLLAGPCARCHRPKTEVVKAILDQRERLVTHVAMDSRCAQALLSS